MNIKIGKIKLHIDITLLLIIFLFVVFEKVRAYFANYFVCFLFVAFHELAHIFIAAIFGVECIAVNIRLCGMNAVFKPQNRLSVKWLYILIAGPISNIILAVIFNKVDLVRNVNFSLALVNMLPLFPLDGYEIFKTLLAFFMPKGKIENVLKTLKKVILTFMMVLGIYLIICIKNPSVLIFVIYVVMLQRAQLVD